jgi:twitching motility protein PilT
VEILQSTPRTREYIENGEAEGKSLLDAMRDGKLDGMQDFDTVIKDFIERKIIAVEDGLAFSTNQNNLLLELKGLTSGEDYIRAQASTIVANQASQLPAGFTMTE